MSPFRAIPRAPQATATSTGSVSRTSSLQSESTATTSSSSTPWDTRVGSPVYSTYPGVVAPQTGTLSDGSQSSSGGLLSSKSEVAGLCVGIAIVCILVAGLFIYRVKCGESPKQAQAPDPKSPLPPSVTRSSRVPPSPFQLGSRARHPQQDGVSRSTSSRSQHPSNGASSRVVPSETGGVIEISPLRYQHTDSSITPSISASAYDFGRRRSGSGAIGQINDYHPHPLPSKSLERLSSATAVSMVDSSSYSSQSLLLSRSQVFTIPYETKPHPHTTRPLPVPPIPPPTYEQVTGAKSFQILSTIPDTESRSIADADLLTGSTLSGIQSPNIKSQFHKIEDSFEDSRAVPPSAAAGPIALASHATTAETRSLYKEPVFLRRLRRSNDLNLDDVLEDDNALDMENAMTPRSHRRHHSSDDLDPFSNMNYELPAWLGSDPYPTQTLRPSASQPSLYGATSRSVAASSRVLPSDSSIRTLTPEPTSPPLPPLPAEALAAMEQKQYMKPRYSRAPTYTTVAPSSRPRSAIVGDGPRVDEVLVIQGAERPGWAENSPLHHVTSISRARRHFPTDGFEPEDLHPAKGNRRSDAAISPMAANHRIWSTDSKGPFVDVTRLSDAISVQGLSRAFSVDAPHRGRMSRSPGLARTFSNFSSLHSSFQGARTGIMSTFEGSGWLDKDRLTQSAGLNSAADIGRGSMAPSSNVLPSEAASIRSISPEIGWIDPESLHGHGNDNDHPAQRGELAVIREAEHSESIQTTTLETAANVRVSWRASRMSIGEDGILWGRLTSAMEQEQKLIEQPS